MQLIIHGCLFKPQSSFDRSCRSREHLVYYGEKHLLLQGNVVWVENVGATYRRLVNKVFKEHIGKTMKVYADDMLVKSATVEQHVMDLAKTFATIKLIK